MYRNLFELDYEYTFMLVGFTEKSEVFDDYVEFYRVFGTKNWVDYDGTVYATLTAKDPGLAFDAFQKLCENK